MFQKRPYLFKLFELNFAVLLISTSGVLGRYISLHPAVTIFYRTLLAAIFFYLFCRWRKIDLQIANKKDVFRIILGGFLMAIHWVTYFYSLQLSNVAIALLSLFTYPVITAFLEPLLLKSRFQKNHLLLGILILGGVYFLTPEINFDNDYFIAVILGLISALFYALRNILMKKEIEKYHGSVLMLYQIVVVCILLTPTLFFSDFQEVKQQWLPLLILAILTTCIGHTLFLKSLKSFSVTAVSIMSSIQPVYGILLGVLFLSEIPELETILGGILIVGAVLMESLNSFRKSD